MRQANVYIYLLKFPLDQLKTKNAVTSQRGFGLCVKNLFNRSSKSVCIQQSLGRWDIKKISSNSAIINLRECVVIDLTL